MAASATPRSGTAGARHLRAAGPVGVHVLQRRERPLAVDVAVADRPAVLGEIGGRPHRRKRDRPPQAACPAGWGDPPAGADHRAAAAPHRAWGAGPDPSGSRSSSTHEPSSSSVEKCTVVGLPCRTRSTAAGSVRSCSRPAGRRGRNCAAGSRTRAWVIADGRPRPSAPRRAPGPGPRQIDALLAGCSGNPKPGSLLMKRPRSRRLAAR